MSIKFPFFSGFDHCKMRAAHSACVCCCILTLLQGEDAAQSLLDSILAYFEEKLLQDRCFRSSDRLTDS